MKGKELLETYPRVIPVIKKWFTEKMIESMGTETSDVPEDFKKQMLARGVPDEMLINVIDKNPSALFEIFDNLNVYIGIVVDRLPETDKVVFNYFVCPNGTCLESSPQEYLCRKDVEHYAMLDAIQYIDSHFDELIKN